MSEENFTLVPNVGVGKILLGTEIETYVDRYGLTLNDELGEIHGLMTYKAKSKDLSVSTRNGRIEEVTCYDEIHYKGKNLIGLRESDIVKILGKPTEINDSILFDDSSVCTPWYYSQLGLEVWFSSEKVYLVSCMDLSEP